MAALVFLRPVSFNVALKLLDLPQEIQTADPANELASLQDWQYRKVRFEEGAATRNRSISAVSVTFTDDM